MPTSSSRSSARRAILFVFAALAGPIGCSSNGDVPRPADSTTPRPQAVIATTSAVAGATTTTTDPFLEDLKARGGVIKPFDAKAHPEVELRLGSPGFILSTPAFEIGFERPPSFDVLAATGTPTDPTLPRPPAGFESLGALDERPDGYGEGVFWFTIPTTTRFDESVALAQMLDLMQSTNQPPLSNTTIKMGSYDARVLVSAPVVEGQIMRLEFRVLVMADKRTVVGLVAGHKAADAAGEKRRTAFLASFHPR